MKSLKTLYSLLAESRWPLWILSGTERRSRLPLTIGFAGPAQTKSYLAGLVFGEASQERPLGRRFFWSCLPEALRQAPDLSLFLWEVPPPHEGVFRPQALAILPGWIELSLDLTDSESCLASKRFRKAANEVEKHGLSLEVTRRPDDFDAYYREILEPYLRSRHGESMIAVPRAAMRREFLERDHELLLIKQGSSVLAGAVIGYADGQAVCWKLGIRLGGGNAGGARLGDVAYHFQVRRAVERKCASLSLGFCRPFLSDGLMDYKRSWGGRLAPHRMEAAGSLVMSVLRPGDAIDGFLQANPFVAVEAGRYVGQVFVKDPGAPEAAQALDYWRSRYDSPAVGMTLRAL